jgi:succinylglutamic semialdehyde dehydrogenase
LIITNSSQPERLISALVTAIQQIRVGLPFDQPEPFMGTLIRPLAAERLLAAQAVLITEGAQELVSMRRPINNAALLTPGLVDVTGIEMDDVEHFGPLLTVSRVSTFDDAIASANATRFGLAAGLLADDVKDYRYFCDRIRAGIVNWNRQTTGASGRLPFGGIGASGNHAPSGFFAADYCAYPVASLESDRLPDVVAKVSPGLEDVARCLSN